MLLNAAYENNIEEVVYALNNGADINALTAEGVSSLHYCVVNTNKDVFNFLIDRGANVNQKDNSGNSPLSVAAQLGLDSMMYILIRAGSDISSVNNNGESPLHLAVLSGNPAAAEMLLYHGADPDLKDNDSLAPLHYAAYNGLEQMTELLLFYQANVNVTDNEGQNPGFYALLSNSILVLRILAENRLILNSVNTNRFSLFETALFMGNEDFSDYIFSQLKTDNLYVKEPRKEIVQKKNAVRIWKNTLQSDFLKSKGLLKKYNVKRPLFPVPGYFYGQIGVSGVTDFFMTGSAHLQEVNYKLHLGIGYGTRLWRNRVYTEQTNDTLLLLHEFRSFIFAEFLKYFTIFRSEIPGRSMNILFGVKMPYSWTNNSGTDFKLKNRFDIIPVAGFDYFTGGIRFHLFYQYWNYDKRNFSPHMVSSGISFRIKTIKH